MKLAVLSDIHANLVALQTVLEHLEQWRPDVVVVAGDVVNRGPRPKECLRLVLQKQREAGWHLLIGNHEEYVLSHTRPDAVRCASHLPLFQPSAWTCEQVAEELNALCSWPFWRDLAANRNGAAVRITHASMLGLRDGIFPETHETELACKMGDPLPQVFCVGHTHQPLIRLCSGVLVVNAGAVGVPFDGDPRASYAQITYHRNAWHAEIVRLPYDRAQAERDFYDSTFFTGTAPIGRVVFREWQLSRGLLYSFMAEYAAPVQRGEIGLEEAVKRFLSALS